MATKVTKIMMTETAHRLPGHGSGCRFIHGHSYKWEVTLEGAVKQGIGAADGMVIDFTELKKAMETFIKPFDHAIVIMEGDPVGEDIYVVLRKHGLADGVLSVTYRPTAELMASYVAQRIRNFFMGQYSVTVRLWETPTSFAEVTV